MKKNLWQLFTKKCKSTVFRMNLVAILLLWWNQDNVPTSNLDRFILPHLTKMCSTTKKIPITKNKNHISTHRCTTGDCPPPYGVVLGPKMRKTCRILAQDDMFFYQKYEIFTFGDQKMVNNISYLREIVPLPYLCTYVSTNQYRVKIHLNDVV